MKFLMTYAQRPDAPPPTPEHMAAIHAFAETNIKAVADSDRLRNFAVTLGELKAVR